MKRLMSVNEHNLPVWYSCSTTLILCHLCNDSVCIPTLTITNNDTFFESLEYLIRWDAIHSLPIGNYGQFFVFIKSTHLSCWWDAFVLMMILSTFNWNVQVFLCRNLYLNELRWWFNTRRRKTILGSSSTVSRRKVIVGAFVCMRWKEKCFFKPWTDGAKSKETNQRWPKMICQGYGWLEER